MRFRTETWHLRGKKWGFGTETWYLRGKKWGFGTETWYLMGKKWGFSTETWHLIGKMIRNRENACHIYFKVRQNWKWSLNNGQWTVYNVRYDGMRYVNDLKPLSCSAEWSICWIIAGFLLQIPHLRIGMTLKSFISPTQLPHVSNA